MSMFVHRCTECPHAHFEHEASHYKGRACSFGWCPCSKVLADVIQQPPELMPTRVGLGGVGIEGTPIETISTPGQKINAIPQAGVQFACGCALCEQAYADASAA